MTDTVRDYVVDALAEYQAELWKGYTGQDLDSADSAVREQAKEMADLVFEALGISDDEQDLTFLSNWDRDRAVEIAHRVIDNDAIGASRKDIRHGLLEMADLVRKKKEVPA